LQTLADQIALAIDNARLLTESQQSLIELYRLYEAQVAQAWDEYLYRRTLAYEYNQSGVTAVSPSHPHAIPVADDQSVINLPISFRGQTLGTILLSRDADEEPFSMNEIAIARATISQLALSLENARLIESTYRQAERDRIATTITSKLWNSSDIDSILQTAVHELGLSLEVSDAYIELDVDAMNESNQNHAN